MSKRRKHARFVRLGKRPRGVIGGKQLTRDYWDRIEADWTEKGLRTYLGPRMRPYPVVVNGIKLEAAPNGDRWPHDLGYESYADYLASNHWRNVKRRYRQSGKPLVCFACGDRSYQLHHRTYDNLGRENLNDLVPLCDGCHGEAHRVEGRIIDGQRVTIGTAPEIVKARREEAD